MCVSPQPHQPWETDFISPLLRAHRTKSAVLFARAPTLADTINMPSAPTSILFNGAETPLFTFQQLEQLSRQHLKNRVNDLKDQLGADNLPALAGHSPDVTIAWILNVQCAMCMGKGVRLTAADFGAPAAGAEGFFGAGEAMPQSSKGKAGGDYRPPMAEHDTNSAYESSANAAAQARARNMQSNVF